MTKIVCYKDAACKHNTKEPTHSTATKQRAVNKSKQESCSSQTLHISCKRTKQAVKNPFGSIRLQWQMRTGNDPEYGTYDARKKLEWAFSY